MANVPLVSIHIITYNQKNYIDETIMSALAQDYDNFEIVVADDGSTDGTDEIVLSYARKYPGTIVPVVGEVNIGITGNSNRALKVCRGAYIAFQGGDDLILPGKLSAQVEWMEADKSRVLCGHEVEVFYNDNIRKPHKQTRKLYSGSGASEFIRKGVPFQGTSIMVRATAVPKIGFDSRLKTYSDNLFFIDVVANGGIYGYIGDIYARYRRHGNNVSADYLSVYKEWETMYHILNSRYPNLKKQINYGLATKVLYSTGVQFVRNREHRKAIHYFLKAQRIVPYSIRGCVRIIQCLIMMVVYKNKGITE